MEISNENCQTPALSACSAGIIAALRATAGVAVIIVARDSTVVSWNAGAEIIYGFPSAAVIGKKLSFLWPANEAAYYEGAFRRVFAGESLNVSERRQTASTGDTRLVHIFGEPVRDDKGDVVYALLIGRDITEETETREQLNALSAHEYSRSVVLGTASQVALDILASRQGVEALRHIADAARTLAGARYAALGVARPDGNGLMEFVTVGLTSEEESEIGPRPTGRGVLGLLLNRTEPLRIEDISKHAVSSGFPPNHPVMKSFLGVPIRRGDQILGSLYLTDKIGSLAFSEADEDAVQALGAHAAVAIHNLQMLSRQKALVSGLIMAQEEERRAVAYDLHDGLTQFVMASHAHLETFRKAYDQANTEKAKREMDMGLRYLKEAVIESRRLVNGLRSLALDDLGLAGALEQQIQEDKNRAEWDDADLIHNIAGRRFDKALETAVYRVAQEAITNARKHANATRVRVVLLLGPDPQRMGNQLTLEVRDWGSGFAPEQKVGEYNHLGLHGMIERVSLMGGTYDLESRIGEGTRIRATFPIMEPRTSDASAKQGDE
ncbi:MAG: GAF domain-containing protein [Capsulimonadaceae bacterium]|nr:GAF domain-containing protein [Capsulimonadaceae bacterium]